MISKPRLIRFANLHPDSLEPIMRWYRIVKRARWEHLADTRKDFPHADPVGDRTVFNIGGNKYRLIVSINYQWKTIFIKEVFTHRDYNRRVE